MTPRLTRRGLFAAGIAALIGTRPEYIQPVHAAVPGTYLAPPMTYVSPASVHVGAVYLNEFAINEASHDSWVSNIKVTITGVGEPVADMATQEV